MEIQLKKRGPAVQRKSKLTIAIAAAALAVLGATVIYAHDQSRDLATSLPTSHAAYHSTLQATAPAKDKYSLTTSSGIAFADFRGYEDWSVVSSARTDEVLKVIVANPTMINAFKSGVPLNGQPFPDGSRIAKLQWKFKKERRSSLRGGCAFRRSPRFSLWKRTASDSRKRRMGIRAVQLRRPSRQVRRRSQPRRLRKHLPHRREGQGLHLPPLPDALNPTGRPILRAADSVAQAILPVLHLSAVSPTMCRLRARGLNGASKPESCRSRHLKCHKIQTLRDLQSPSPSTQTQQVYDLDAMEFHVPIAELS